MVVAIAVPKEMRFSVSTDGAFRPSIGAMVSTTAATHRMKTDASSLPSLVINSKPSR